MSKTRMAGEKMEEGRRKSQLQQRLGDEEFERIGAKGYQDQRKGDKYSAAEVKSELRSGQYGDTVDERVDHFRQLQEDGTKFNSKAQQFLSSKYGFEFGKKDKPEEPESPVVAADLGSRIPVGLADLERQCFDGSGHLVQQCLDAAVRQQR